MAKQGYAAYRDAVLEGTDPDGRDHPTKRARAAWEYQIRVDQAAQAAVDGAEAALEKAHAAVDAAERNLAEAKRDKTAAARELEHAREVVKDVRAEHGDDPDAPAVTTEAPADPAEGTGR